MIVVREARKVKRLTLEYRFSSVCGASSSVLSREFHREKGEHAPSEQPSRFDHDVDSSSSPLFGTGTYLHIGL